MNRLEGAFFAAFSAFYGKVLTESSIYQWFRLHLPMSAQMFLGPPFHCWCISCAIYSSFFHVEYFHNIPRSPGTWLSSFTHVIFRNMKWAFKFWHVYFFQQYGNKVGDGQFQGKAIPTYVYPDCLKAAIREILNGAVRDYPNPETSAVRILFFRIVQPPDTISPKRRL